MAKNRDVNKSAAIKEYLTKNPGVGPADAAADLTKKLGVEVTPTYVSNIKFHMQHAGGKRGKRKKSRAGANGAGALATVNAAVDFVKAAGGIDAAKAALATVEQIGDAVGRR